MIPVTVTFYGDVGFDRSYNHVIDFSNETERENYFSPRILKSIQDCAYNKPMNSLQIKCPYEEALNFTYCKFIIGSSINSRKIIYAWVDDVVLITDQKDENNTFVPILQINISVDPWQTFLFNIRLGESFVVREHVDRFKLNGDGTRGWCLDNTSDTSSLGLEKRVKDLILSRKTFNHTSPNVGTYNVYWVIIQAVENIETTPRLRTYLVPFCSSPLVPYGPIDSSNYAKQMMNVDYLYSGQFLSLLGIASNTVASVYFIPFDIFNCEKGTYCVHPTGNYTQDNYFGAFGYQTGGDYGYYIASINLSILQQDEEHRRIVITRDFDFIEDIGLTIPQNGDNYSITHEPQLYKNPFKRFAIIDSNGIDVGQLPDISVNMVSGFTGIRIRLLLDSVEARIRIIPLYSFNSPKIEMDNLYWVEFSLPRVDVLSSNWLNFLLQERETAREMIASQINQQAIANAIGGVSSAVGQGGGQAMSVGKAQVGQSELGGFAAGASVGLGVGAIQTVGNYIANKHFAFEQQDIREKAIKRKANNVQESGTFKSNSDKLRVVLIECDATTMDLKSKEFHKYGYSVYRYETPNIKTRKYFNFIATNIVKIEGSLNNNIKIALMQIFNNGVTIWHGDYIHELTGIGDYSRENIERSLL